MHAQCRTAQLSRPKFVWSAQVPPELLWHESSTTAVVLVESGGTSSNSLQRTYMQDAILAGRYFNSYEYISGNNDR